ncbi:coiled-coil domain-containing protein [Streptomyces chrestomyceticus]|uniref:coiled-coil domain-containing protein n=1 Tax=Streptomyces chrestomyceticus TaxID=68185 RepID=UPI0037BB58CE
MTVAGASLACASGVWFVGDDLAQRVLATGAAAAAVTGSVLLRAWDRTAGKSVAELKNARVRDEWKTDERIAELETDLEESRGIRGKLDTKLRAKRAELARLRSEHAELLRRYATAETERASALEGRRLLAIETGTPAGELTAGTADGPDGSAPGVLTAGMYHRAAEALRQLPRNAARQSEDAQGRDGADGRGEPGAATEGPATERPAAQGPVRTAAVPGPGGRKAGGANPGGSKAGVTNPGVTKAGASGSGASKPGASGRGGPKPDGPNPGASMPAASGAADAQAGTADGAGRGRGRGSAELPDAGTGAGTGAGVDADAGSASGLRPVPAAAAVVAPVRAARLPASRLQGGFDFFGTATGTGAVREGAPQGGPGAGAPSTVTRRPKPVRQLEEDLADVVGDEAVAEQSALGRAHDGAPEPTVEKPGKSGKPEQAKAAATEKTAETAEDEVADAANGEVIDLTAHDETEQIDLAELRSAVSS